MSLNILMTHWKDSLGFFKLANLKLFMLASLNCLVRSLRAAPWFFWIQIAAVSVYYPFFLQKTGPLTISSEVFILFIAKYILLFSISIQVLFIMALGARQSVERKDNEYFYRSRSLAGFFLLFYLILPYFLMPFSIIALLFFLDHQATVKNIFLSLRRSLKMIIHFFVPISFLTAITMIPVYWLIFETRCSCWLSISKVWSILGLAGIYFLIMVLQIFFVCMMTTYYVKLKHTYKDFFFGKPEDGKETQK